MRSGAARRDRAAPSGLWRVCVDGRAHRACGVAQCRALFVVPGNAGLGLELKVIAAVVVGGTAITGGRGTLRNAGRRGIVRDHRHGADLLSINPFWEQSIQGAIILAALVSDAVIGRFERLRITKVVS